METLDEYLAEFYTSETAKAYKREIKRFLLDLPAARGLFYRDLINYLGILRKRYPNPNTLSRIVSSIKVYYEYLSHTGRRKDNPAASLKLRDKKSRDIQLQDLFTADELDTLLESKERYSLLVLRNRVLTSLLIYQALSPKELEFLRVNDIDLQKGIISINDTPKTNKRELPLQVSQVMLLHEYISQSRVKLLKINSTSTLLVGMNGNAMQAGDITKHIKRQYGNKFAGRKITATSIRQSVICNLLKQGKDLREVQVFAGHKYLSSTEKYKQTDLEVLKSEIEKHYPLK